MVTTPEQFAAEMQKIQDTSGGDEEGVHIAMDNLMTRVLTELGYHKGVAIFDSQSKWYA